MGGCSEREGKREGEREREREGARERERLRSTGREPAGQIQGYLAHRKQPPPLEPPKDPRYGLTVDS